MTRIHLFAIAGLIFLVAGARPAHAGLWDKLTSVFCERSLKVATIAPEITDPAALRAAVEANLGRKTEIAFSATPEMQGRMPGEQITLRGQNGAWIAGMTYFYEKSGLRIGEIEVGVVFQRQGVSEYLFSEMLARHPKIDLIDTTLLGTNLTILNQALEKGIDCPDAIRETPAFKLRQRFGFGLLQESYCDGMAGFTVTRPGRSP